MQVIIIQNLDKKRLFVLKHKIHKYLDVLFIFRTRKYECILYYVKIN